jgi:carbon starvation protein
VRYAWTTLLPLAWLLAVTMTAGWQKIFAADPRIGFLAQAAELAGRIAAGGVAAEKIGEIRAQVFNLRLDAVVTAVFMALVAVIVVEAGRVWWRALRRPAPAGVVPAPTGAGG